MQKAPVAAGYRTGELSRMRPYSASWKRKALLSPNVFPFATENHFQAVSTSEILTLKAFSLSLGSVTNIAPATPCYFVGLKWASLQFAESCAEANACTCYGCLFPDRKAIPKA